MSGKLTSDRSLNHELIFGLYREPKSRPFRWTSWDLNSGKNMNGSEWGEANYFFIPFELSHGIQMMFVNLKDNLSTVESLSQPQVCHMTTQFCVKPLSELHLPSHTSYLTQLDARLARQLASLALLNNTCNVILTAVFYPVKCFQQISKRTSKILCSLE